MNHGQQVVWQLGKSHVQWLIHQVRLRVRYCGNFEFLIFLGNFRKGLRWKHSRSKYKEWVSFLGSWGTNRNAEQTHRPRTASRFTRFCVSRALIHSPLTQNKDIHSLLIRMSNGQVGCTGAGNSFRFPVNCEARGTWSDKSYMLLYHLPVRSVKCACQIWSLYTSYGSKVIAKVKVVDRQTDRQTDTQDKQYVPDLSILGHKKLDLDNLNNYWLKCLTFELGIVFTDGDP